LNPEKVVKYSVPFFVIAIISRSIEEISFFYYAVPVMSLMFIVLVLQSSRFSSTRIQEGDPSTPLRMTNPKEGTIRYPVSGIQSPESSDKHPSSPPKADFASLNIISARGGFRFAQHLPSPIIPLPFLLFLLPGLWFLLTSLWSSYPEVSALRALYFILISTGCMSAGILWQRYSGKGIFDFLLPANIFVVLLCLFSVIINIPSDSWTGGHGKGFIGFFGHQNLLASVILFTLPGVIFKLHSKAGVNSNQSSVNRNHNSNTNYFLLTTHYLLLTANLLLLTLTYSRSAILSLIFGMIVFLILTKSWKIISYSFIIAAVFTFIIYFTPSLNQLADKIIKKDFPEVYSSRIWMWEPSYRAALEGGLIGLGYGISHPEIRSGEYSDRFENGRLIREKGNSSLALVEEAGLIGLILFLIPIFYILLRVISGKVSLLATNYSLLTAALAAFLLHSQFEAWWVGVGSVQLPLFFIYTGLLTGYQQIKSQ